MSRRVFLQGAVLIAAARLPTHLQGYRFTLQAPRSNPKLPSLTASVLRRDDMLVLDFEFYNLSLKNGSLERTVANKAAYVVAVFPPQSIAEEAFYEGDPKFQKVPGVTDTSTAPIGALLAGPSRLVFKVPDAVDSIPYELDAVLAWTGLEQNVAPNAKRTFTQGLITPITPKKPDVLHTYIEAPWALYISPNQYARWSHSLTPVTRGEGPNERTELWHTRLSEKSGAQSPPPDVSPLAPGGNAGPVTPKVRAIWTPGFKKDEVPPDDNKPFRMSLNKHDRYDFVRLTSDQFYSNQPKAAIVDQLMLTSLGAWMKLRGSWTPSPPLTREDWRHQATMGRDHYVRVVVAGYLGPFGHKASLVKITERKFEPLGTGAMQGAVAAVLRQRFFLIVREPEKAFPAPGQPNASRAFPFKNVRITTLITPNLDKPEDDDIDNAGQAAFWPKVGQKDFLFHIVGTDFDGQTSEFTAPLIFADIAIAEDAIAATKAADVIAAYNANSATARRSRDLSGQKVAYAKSTKTGDTALETKVLELAAEGPGPGNNPPTGQPHFYPTIKSANVRLQAVEAIQGKELGAGGVKVRYHEDYVKKNFGPSEVFMQLATPAGLDFGGNTDRSGGVITPNVDIGAVSRLVGPVGGMPPNGQADAPLPTQFKPEDFFAGAVPKLLGAENLLIDIVKAAAFGSDKAPQITNEVIYPGGDKSKAPVGVLTKLSWAPDLQQDPVGFFTKLAGASLVVNARIETRYDQPQPISEVTGDMKNFAINLLGNQDPVHFITIEFDRLRFTSVSGEKPDVEVDIREVKFAGILTFVNDLKDLLNFGGSGPHLDVTPTGIEAGFTIAIPNISVGVFNIQNISFLAGCSLQFSGNPVRVRFGFCTRDDPFLLSIMIFGGGGFFGIGLGADGMELLEASLEFGAVLALDIGVASGKIELMAGIYFKMEKDPNAGGKENALLTGYVRLGGELNVLGIITLSLEFNLSLTFETPDTVYGQATLTVEVSVLMFSADVTMTVEKQFGGSGGGMRRAQAAISAAGASFEDFYSQDDWDKYAGAFAAYPA